MKRIKIIVLVFFFINISFPNLFAQANLFNSIVNDLKENIKSVSTSKKTIEQEIKIAQEGVINLTINEIDQKGRKIEYLYEFNPADIDPIMVREVTDKDKIFVQLITNNNQKLITKFKNGVLSSYDKIVKISANDIDNARMIKDQIKNLIPAAKVIMDSRFNLRNYEEKLNWLTENVKDVNINNESFQQKLIKDDVYVGKLNFESVRTTEKLTKTKKIEFNLADVNINSVNFEIKGAVFSIVFEIKGKQKVIKSYVDNKLVNYGYNVTIVAYNIENARDLKYVLTKIIPEAEKKVQNSFPEITSLNQATKFLSKNIGNTVIENTTVNQSLENSCITSLNVLKDDTKKRTDSKYIFNLSDFNQHAVNYKISGKRIFITLQTKGSNKLIKVLENDEQQNYISELEILCQDNENARLLSYSIRKAIPLCEENIVRVVPKNNLGNKIDWLIDNTVEVSFEGKTYNQVLEKISGDNNKLRLTLVKANDKKKIELIYEFNLSDINPNTVEYDISGKELSISLTTNFNTKVVKVYKDGEIQNYANQINIYVLDIESARNFIVALKESIKENTN